VVCKLERAAYLITLDSHDGDSGITEDTAGMGTVFTVGISLTGDTGDNNATNCSFKTSKL